MTWAGPGSWVGWLTVLHLGIFSFGFLGSFLASPIPWAGSGPGAVPVLVAFWRLGGYKKNVLGTLFWDANVWHPK